MSRTVPIEDLRGVDAADVHKAGRLAGRLVRQADDVVFSYDRGYLADGTLPAVASTLPRADRELRASAGAVPTFFAGLLPEGVRLRVVSTAARTSEDDHLTVLLAVGADTIGDVQVVPAGTRPGTEVALLDEEQVEATSLAEVFARATTPSTTTLDRVGLPGVQVKVSARMMSTPLRTGRGPAILKLDPPEYPRLVENEDFCLRLASAAGLPVPTHRLVHDREGRAGLLVARFDRVVTADGVMRLAQEDACQLLDRYPAAKYRLTLEEAIRAAAAAVGRGGGSPPLTVRQALELGALSYLIGNGDLHGKNLSVGRRPDGLWGLTPAYDLVTTQPYLAWRDPMALPLYGRAARLGRRWWLEAAERLGVPQRALTRRLDAIAETARAWADRVGEIGFDEQTTERLGALLRTRSDELLT